MTIGMLLESLVSKAGALGGRFVDGSPFQAADGGATAQDLVQTAGDTLEATGFSRLGGGQACFDTKKSARHATCWCEPGCVAVSVWSAIVLTAVTSQWKKQCSG